MWGCIAGAYWAPTPCQEPGGRLEIHMFSNTVSEAEDLGPEPWGDGWKQEGTGGTRPGEGL